MSDNDQLKRIEESVKTLNDKVDRLLVGSHGVDGLIGRVARVEDRQGLLAWVAGVLAAVTAGLTAALASTILPGWFKQH